MFLSNKVPLVAVDIGSHSVKLAQLKQTRAGFELVSFALVPLQPDVIAEGVVKDSGAVVEAITSLVKAEKVTTRFAIGSVAGEAVIIKKIKLPPMTREELDENIHKEAEQYIPFDIDDVSMDFQILSYPEENRTDLSPGEEEGEESAENGNKMEVLLVAVQREIIDSRTEILLEAGLKPVLMDLDVFAVMNAVGLSAEMDRAGAVTLVDLGDSFTHIHLVNGGVSYFTRDFKTGGCQCTDKLQSAFEVPFEDATAIKTGSLPSNVDKQGAVDIIVESFDPILNEIESASEAFETQTGRKPEKVILSGGGALVPGVGELFQNDLKMPVEVFDPLRFVGYDRKKFDSRCIADIGPIATVAIGLATRRFDYQG